MMMSRLSSVVTPEVVVMTTTIAALQWRQKWQYHHSRYSVKVMGCITTATWRCRKPFTRKLCCHWLKFCENWALLGNAGTWSARKLMFGKYPCRKLDHFMFILWILQRNTCNLTYNFMRRWNYHEFMGEYVHVINHVRGFDIVPYQFIMELEFTGSPQRYWIDEPRPRILMTAWKLSKWYICVCQCVWLNQFVFLCSFCCMVFLIVPMHCNRNFVLLENVFNGIL